MYLPVSRIGSPPVFGVRVMLYAPRSNAQLSPASWVSSTSRANSALKAESMPADQAWMFAVPTLAGSLGGILDGVGCEAGHPSVCIVGVQGSDVRVAGPGEIVKLKRSGRHGAAF